MATVAGERHDAWESPLMIRYGQALMEYGFTAIPNLFLRGYCDLGLDDGEAVFVIQLFTRKRGPENVTFRLADLPLAASLESRKRCLQRLRELGLVFTRRVYMEGVFPARIRHIEIDLTSLFYNLTRWREWVETGREGTFAVRLDPQVAAKIRADAANGSSGQANYHFVPKKWQRAAAEAAPPVPGFFDPVQAAVPRSFDPSPQEDLSGDTGRLFEPPGGPRGGRPARISPLASGSTDNPPEAATSRTQPSGRPGVPEAVNAAPPHGMPAGRAVREPLPAEPLPCRRQRVLEDLRRAQGKPRREVAILTQNVAAVLGLDGGRRVIPERSDYGRVGALAKRFGAEAVWTTACRIAGLGIDGDALAYLQRCLEQDVAPADLSHPHPSPPPPSPKREGRGRVPPQGRREEAEESLPPPRRPLPFAGDGQRGMGQLVLGAGHLRPNQPLERSAYIANLVMDIGRQFGDVDHFRENDAQAHNLWRASGLDDQAFVKLVYQARDTALRLAGARNRMAYFFTVLRNLLQPEAETGRAAAAGSARSER